MQGIIRLDAIYTPSNDIVAREIEEELIIIPLVAGIGDTDDDLFALNESGRAIWNRMNGKTNLIDVVADLSSEYRISPNEIEQDVLSLVKELVVRKMLVEVTPD